MQLKLKDGDGFELGSMPITRSELTQIHAPGQAGGWTFSKTVAMQGDLYDAVASVDVTWYPSISNAAEAFLETDAGKTWKEKKDKKLKFDPSTLVPLKQES